MENTAAIVIQSEELSLKEQRRFDACIEEYKTCEEVINKQSVNQFRILRIIRDERLYRAKYGTGEGAFTACYKAELGEHRSVAWAHAGISKLEACEVVSEAFGVPVDEIELSFRSARIIKKIDPEDVVEVVESALEQSGKITPKSLEGAISKIEDREEVETQDETPSALGIPDDGWVESDNWEVNNDNRTELPSGTTEADLAEAEESAFTTTDETNQSIVEEFGDAVDVRPVNEEKNPAILVDALTKKHVGPACRDIDEIAKANGVKGPNYAIANESLNSLIEALKELRKGNP